MENKLMHFCAAAAVACAIAGTSPAAIIINEIGIDFPGVDNGQEFFELASTTGGAESLGGLHFLSIDGDSTSAGVIDQAIPLSGLTGLNGLFLRRDAASVIGPAPHPSTVVTVGDFAPDLENGSNTFALVVGFTGAVGTDLDTNNDGTIDVPLPWTSLVDSIGVTENDGPGNFIYLGTGFAANPAFNPDAVVRLRDGRWISMDVNGNLGGPYSFDAAEIQDIDGAPIGLTHLDITTLTPGSANPIPEPTSIALAALALAGASLGQRRRKR